MPTQACKDGDGQPDTSAASTAGNAGNKAGEEDMPAHPKHTAAAVITSCANDLSSSPRLHTVDAPLPPVLHVSPEVANGGATASPPRVLKTAAPTTAHHNKPTVLVCGGGNAAQTGAAFFSARGYTTHVLSMRPGHAERWNDAMRSWRPDEGAPAAATAVPTATAAPAAALAIADPADDAHDAAPSAVAMAAVASKPVHQHPAVMAAAALVDADTSTLLRQGPINRTASSASSSSCGSCGSGFSFSNNFGGTVVTISNSRRSSCCSSYSRRSSGYSFSTTSDADIHGH